MDTQTYDQLHGPGRDGRRRRALPAGEPGGDRRHPRGRAAVRRAAGVGRADHHLHRARPAGRPVHRRHQAGHRSRPAYEIARPAVHHDRRARSRSTPATARTSAGSPADLVTARSKARKRALDVLFESDQRGVDVLDGPGRPPAARRPAGRRVRRDRSSRASPSTATASTTWSQTYSQGWTLDRMPAVDRAVLRMAIYRAAVRATTSRTRSSSTRRSSWPSSCRPTSPRRSSTGCSPGS